MTGLQHSGSHANDWKLAVIEHVPNPHLAALVERYARGRSVRRIESDAGVREGVLAQYLKPSASKRDRLPTVATIKEVAHALGATVRETADAFAADVDLPLSTSDTVSREDRRMLDVLATLSDQDRSLVRGFVDLVAANRHAAP